MNTNTQRPGTNLIHVGLLLVVVGIVLAIATLAAGGNAVLGLVSALGLLLAQRLAFGSIEVEGVDVGDQRSFERLDIGNLAGPLVALGTDRVEDAVGSGGFVFAAHGVGGDRI